MNVNDEALRRHWDEEVVRFGLKPWECPPCMVEASELDAAGWGGTVARARELHAQIVANDPRHYADLWQRPKSTKRRA